MSTEPWLIALDTELLIRSRAADMLETAFAHRRGPKMWISWLGFLLAIRLAARRKYFMIQDAAEIYLGLPDEVHHRFGLPTRASRKAPAFGKAPRTMQAKVHDDFNHIWETLRWELDSSPVTRPYLTPHRRQQVYELRVAFCDALGSGWLPPIHHDAHVEDGTAQDGFRNPKQGGDPHLTRGQRTPTYRDPRDRVDGFDLDCIIAALIGPGLQPPYVILCHELVPAIEPEGNAALRLYQRHRQDCALRWVIGDKWLSHTPVDYSLQILNLGGWPVHDLHEDLRGQSGVMLGFWVIDSWLWHPDLPAEYWNMTSQASNRRDGAYRSLFAAQLLCGPTDERPSEILAGCPGHAYGNDHPATLSCPGTGSAPLVPHAESVDRCPNSELCRAEDGVWVSLIDKHGEPNEMGRTFQFLPRLSPQWWNTYRPPRAHVENGFSTLTTPTGANLADRAHWISGLPGTAIWVANGVATQNHNRVWTWSQEVSGQLDPVARRRLESDVLYADRWRLIEHYDRLFRK